MNTMLLVSSIFFISCSNQVTQSFNSKQHLGLEKFKKNQKIFHRLTRKNTLHFTDKLQIYNGYNNVKLSSTLKGSKDEEESKEDSHDINLLHMLYNIREKCLKIQNMMKNSKCLLRLYVEKQTQEIIDQLSIFLVKNNPQRFNRKLADIVLLKSLRLFQFITYNFSNEETLQNITENGESFDNCVFDLTTREIDSIFKI